MLTGWPALFNYFRDGYFRDGGLKRNEVANGESLFRLV
jgi:hypothetical protein